MNPQAFNPLPLDAKPRIAASAPTVHGYEGKEHVERYRLPTLWCLHVYRYEADMYAGEHHLPLRPGVATLVPPDTPLEYHYRGLSPHFYVHFELGETGTQAPLVPLRQELGERLTEVEADLRFIAAQLAANPARAEIRLWDLLWRLADRTNTTSARHPALEKAIGLIELRLGQPIEIAKLAREVGLSHNHLIRLFHEEFEVTIAGYIRRRRTAQARHLLMNTSLPVKAIARQVGVADLRGLNAMMKKETGRAPRGWRER